MQLPTRVIVGTTPYTFHYTDKPGTVAGRITYALQSVTIHTHRRKHQPYSDKFIRNTFWHELTHAILKDMDSPLYNNEEFVTAFSDRLSHAIDTAEFNA